MSYLVSSIFGKEFVNYRKNHAHYERTQFSTKIRRQGLGLVPIVVDSIEIDISLILGGNPDNQHRTKQYGKEYTLHIDNTFKDLLDEIKNDINIINSNYLSGKKLKLGLEEGIFVNLDETIGNIYKKSKNQKDDILYILVTQETTVYGYILSILKYLGFK